MNSRLVARAWPRENFRFGGSVISQRHGRASEVTFNSDHQLVRVKPDLNYRYRISLSNGDSCHSEFDATLEVDPASARITVQTIPQYYLGGSLCLATTCFDDGQSLPPGVLVGSDHLPAIAYDATITMHPDGYVEKISGMTSSDTQFCAVNQRVNATEVWFYPSGNVRRALNNNTWQEFADAP